jgi:flagellar protein FlgJ
MMIKNMRKTGMEDPLFNSPAMSSYRDMYDQQLGLELSRGQGIGLAEAIVRQLQHQAGMNNEVPAQTDAQQRTLKMPERRTFYQSDIVNKAPLETAESNTTGTVSAAGGLSATAFNSPQDFVQKLWPMAEKTAAQLGVNPEVILSQAALETGWGKYIIADNNKSSFNLFNIKADKSWQGERMAKVSMEFIHGKPVQQKSDFRAYDSFAESFQDYTKFIQNNPRYHSIFAVNEKAEHKLHNSSHAGKPDALNNNSYIQQLHEAGYATDPQYAKKVLRVLNSDAIQEQLTVASK